MRILSFNHIRESHHSQTASGTSGLYALFNHIRESHHSQTINKAARGSGVFNHIRESHHSQTPLLVYRRRS